MCIRDRIEVGFFIIIGFFISLVVACRVSDIIGNGTAIIWVRTFPVGPEQQLIFTNRSLTGSGLIYRLAEGALL